MQTLSVSMLLMMTYCTDDPKTIAIAVHPSGFEGAHRVRTASEQVLRTADEVVWLRSDDDEWPYDVEHDRIVTAPGGHHSEHLDGRLVFIGGYYGACLKNAVQASLAVDPSAEIVIVAEAVYYGSFRSLAEQMNENPGDYLKRIGLDGNVRIMRIDKFTSAR